MRRNIKTIRLKEFEDFDEIDVVPITNVRQLKEELAQYDRDAEVRLVDILCESVKEVAACRFIASRGRGRRKDEIDKAIFLLAFE